MDLSVGSFDEESVDGTLSATESLQSSGDEDASDGTRQSITSKEKAFSKLQAVKKSVVDYSPEVKSETKRMAAKKKLAKYSIRMEKAAEDLAALPNEDKGAIKQVIKGLLEDRTCRGGWTTLNDHILEFLDTSVWLEIELFGPKTPGLTAAMQLLFRK
jgi:hypothetical protein